MQAVPTAPLLIFVIGFPVILRGPYQYRDIPEGRMSRGGSQALLSSAKQWDKRQQAEMRKNFSGQVPEGTGFHGISPVQSPALMDFRWSCWCSALLQKLATWLAGHFKVGNISVLQLWKVIFCFVKSLALHESSVIKARVEAVIYDSIHVSAWEQPFAS